MKTKNLITFVLAAYLPMIAIGAVQFFLRKGIEPGVLSMKAIISSGLTAMAMFIPLVAIVVTQFITKEPLFRNLGI